MCVWVCALYDVCNHGRQVLLPGRHSCIYTSVHTITLCIYEKRKKKKNWKKWIIARTIQSTEKKTAKIAVQHSIMWTLSHKMCATRIEMHGVPSKRIIHSHISIHTRIKSNASQLKSIDCECVMQLWYGALIEVKFELIDFIRSVPLTLTLIHSRNDAILLCVFFVWRFFPNSNLDVVVAATNIGGKLKCHAAIATYAMSVCTLKSIVKRT